MLNNYNILCIIVPRGNLLVFVLKYHMDKPSDMGVVEDIVRTLVTMDGYWILALTSYENVFDFPLFYIMSILCACLFVLSIIFHLKYRKLKKEYSDTKKNLEESCLELEAANKQLIASEEELNRQFIEIEEQKNKLKLSKERYLLASDGAEFGIWDLDMETKTVYLSKKAREITGVNPQDGNVALSDLKDFLHPSDKNYVVNQFYRHISNQLEIFEVQCRLLSIPKEDEWISIRGKALLDQDNRVIRLAGSVTNISKGKRTEDEIRRLAYFDIMTDLPNRAYFNNWMEEYLKDENPQVFSILFMDIDNFKSINDLLGHSYGDKILVEIAKKLKESILPGSELIRFGGDEFVIIAPLLEGDEASSYLEQLLKGFEEPFEMQDYAFSITFSIGIATYPYDGDEIETLLKHVDLALNDIKSSGKNGYKLFSREMKDTITARVKIESDLIQAIENDEFELYYQPKFDITEQRITGYEALIRWNHPDGMVYPGTFIPIAEETGLIIPIGEWVIREAVKQLDQWNKMGFDSLTIAINLSPRQLRDHRLLEIFKSLDEEYPNCLQNIEVEITETMAIQDTLNGAYVLGQLKKLGLKIALDDFGTGYSSLNYFTALPIDTIKIDRSFVHNFNGEKTKKAVVKAVITLAHACQLKVIAEGVETIEQYEAMKNESCDIIQGYLISKPLPQAKAIGLLEITA